METNTDINTNTNTVKSFKDLIVWVKSHELTLEIYKVTKKFPADEKYGIVSQMRRAAYSIPANIIEGHSRKHKNEFLQFLSIAKGSLEELKYFIILAADLDYISAEEQNKIERLTTEISKILYSFTKRVKGEER